MKKINIIAVIVLFFSLSGDFFNFEGIKSNIYIKTLIGWYIIHYSLLKNQYTNSKIGKQYVVLSKIVMSSL